MGSTDRPLPDSPGMRPAHRRLRSRWLWAGALAVILAAGGVTAAHFAAASGPLPRDQRWQRDIAYLARNLPQDRAGDGIGTAGIESIGLGPVSRAAWDAAAARLEGQVPRLTDGEVIVGMARMVAMLHDDETHVDLPEQPLYQLEAQRLGGGLYLLAVPAADRSLLGARLLAVDGQPVRRVLARIRPVIAGEDATLVSDEEIGALDDARLLHWLGITRSPTAASFTVETVADHQRTVRLRAKGAGDLVYYNWLYGPGAGLARVPMPLYQQHSNLPYWLQVLPAQHAVYLKYNQCLSDNGFQRLAARALAIMRDNPGDRLVVDLRGNAGGDDGPFTSLISGLQADPALTRPARVIGLVDNFTGSSATDDAGSFAQDGHAVLIGEGPADPIAAYGNDDTFQLPYSHLTITYTTTMVRSGTPEGVPDIKIAPTRHQVLAGDDPVLAAALSYRSPAG
jgi:hypothetical protein